MGEAEPKGSGKLGGGAFVSRTRCNSLRCSAEPGPTLAWFGPSISGAPRRKHSASKTRKRAFGVAQHPGHKTQRFRSEPHSILSASACSVAEVSALKNELTRHLFLRRALSATHCAARQAECGVGRGLEALLREGAAGSRLQVFFKCNRALFVAERDVGLDSPRSVF